MTPERVEEIYEALGKLVVVLDPDPTSKGPKYLQDLISKTRGYLNETSVFLTEVFRERHHMELEITALESAFSISSDDLIANDRRVSTLPALQDRLSMVNVILSAERRKILAKQRELKNLGHVEKVIRHRAKELESTMSAIRLQRSLVESEIRTGAFFGDENDESRGRAGKPEEFDDDEIERLMNAEMSLVPESVPSPKPEPESLPVEAAPAPEVARAEPKTEPKTEDDEIADLLAMASETSETPPQEVVAAPPIDPNILRPEPVTDPDKDIENFLNENDNDLDYFTNMP